MGAAELDLASVGPKSFHVDVGGSMLPDFLKAAWAVQTDAVMTFSGFKIFLRPSRDLIPDTP